MFRIEDDFHSDVLPGRYETFESALEELCRIAVIPFGDAPNRPPCSNGMDCVREYHIVECDHPEKSSDQRINCKILEISAAGVTWTLPE